MSQPSAPTEVATAPIAAAPARYPDRHNALQDTKTSSWMWLSMLLGFFLVLWLTLLAVRQNPLYSNVDVNGMSKYKFIEGCRDAINEEVRTAAAKQPGLTVSLNARDLVNGTSEGFQAAPTPGATAPLATTPGWTLIAPMQVHRSGLPTQTATLGCHYSKGGKVELIH